MLLDFRVREDEDTLDERLLDNSLKLRYVSIHRLAPQFYRLSLVSSVFLTTRICH